MNTNSDKTEEILFQTISGRKKEEIVPDDALKDKLDKALAAKRRKKSFFALRIPLYQSVAAAAIFFVLGLGSNFLRLAAPPEIMYTTTEVVKYVEKPVVTEVVKYVDRPVTEIRYVKIKEPVVQQPATRDSCIAQNVTSYNSNENLGISLHEDTVLQKMLVTIQQKMLVTMY